MSEWIHIPTPGDHYSPRTGSAVITVIHQLCQFHTGKSRVIVQRGTMDGYEVGERVEVDYSRIGTPPSWAKLTDYFTSVLTPRRLFSGSAYKIAAETLGNSFAGTVFVHNEPSAVEVLANACPSARICLWAQNELFNTYAAKQVQRVVEKAYCIICCSDFIRHGIEKFVGSHWKIVTVHNGVDTHLFCSPTEAKRPDIPVILFVGRMVPQKGPQLLLAAAKAMKNKGLRFRIRMIGSAGFTNDRPLSSFEKELRELALELGEVVEFAGFLDRSQIAKEFQSADVFCAPSTWDDPCPLTVLEAMASGLAVVGTQRGGIPEEIGDAGVVCKDNLNGLQAALEPVLVSPTLRQQLGAAARLRSENFTWASVQRRLSKILEDDKC